MGKRKSGSSRRSFGGKRKSVTVDSEDELKDEDEPDPKSRSFIYDEIDEFHNDHENALLESGKPYKLQKQLGNEEVYGLNVSDDDEDFEDDDDAINKETIDRFAAMQRKDEMESDLEDEVEDDGSKDRNWGKHKSTYYSTDFVDKDYQTLNESDIELAEAEEMEAKALQQRLAEQMDDNDFGFDIFVSTETKSSGNKVENKIKKDLSTLSKEERLEILKRDSPELLNLLNDFKVKTIEMRDQYQPLLEMVNRNEIPKGYGADYISAKYHLLLNYCTNVCFYLMLKAKQQSLKFHPIIDTLVTYRKLMKELEPLDVKFEDEKGIILDENRLKNETIGLSHPMKEKLPKKVKKNVVEKISVKAKEKAKSSKNVLASIETEELAQKRKAVDRMETEDEKMALEMYQMMKDGRKKQRLQDDSDENEESEVEESEGDVDELEEGSGKRGITYQIAKNKGLTPYRAKERRNPRVKYRMKYRKAKIRRKGQVREVRKEQNKYGGEFSGIKATTVRSIKLK